MADLCAAIGVPRGASSEEVRKWAKEIFKLVHPDKCSLPGAAEAFDVVRTAERVLTDETEWRKHQAEMARRREMDREVQGRDLPRARRRSHTRPRAVLDCWFMTPSHSVVV